MPEAPPPDPAAATPEHRSGFVAIVGRPNVGKSTLLNRLLGQKIAIVSPKPQTTRNRITGIRTRPGDQIVYVDTPGLHPPPGKLGAFMVATVTAALEDVDAVVLVVEATDGPAPHERALAPLGEVSAPVILAVNKVDLLPDKRRVLPLLDAYAHRYPFRELIPISAADGSGVDRLESTLRALLPVGPPFYPADQITDQPETFFVAETIREKIFLLTRQEVPYATAVRVEELVERPDSGRLYIRAVIFVEQPSQKAIVIGEGGAMLKRVGQAARRELEAFFGVPVYLDLWVQVRRHWRRNDAALREFGYRLTS